MAVTSVVVIASVALAVAVASSLYWTQGHCYLFVLLWLPLSVPSKLSPRPLAILTLAVAAVALLPPHLCRRSCLVWVGLVVVVAHTPSCPCHSPHSLRRSRPLVLFHRSHPCRGCCCSATATTTMFAPSKSSHLGWPFTIATHRLVRFGLVTIANIAASPYRGGCCTADLCLLVACVSPSRHGCHCCRSRRQHRLGCCHCAVAVALSLCLDSGPLLSLCLAVAAAVLNPTACGITRIF